jgi:hypothetical protein
MEPDNGFVIFILKQLHLVLTAIPCFKFKEHNRARNQITTPSC